MLGLVAGFDIGGTKISLVVSDSSDERMYRLVEATDLVSGLLDYTNEHSTYHGLAEQLERMLRAALIEQGLARRTLTEQQLRDEAETKIRRAQEETTILMREGHIAPLPEMKID